MTRRDGNSRRLIGAALVTMVFALTLLALGWWVRGWEYDPDRSRYLDPAWWVGSLTSGLGYLAISPTGLKVALLVIGAPAAAALWLRRRNTTDHRPPSDQADHPAQGDPDASTGVVRSRVEGR
ncbi:hypothetical protein ABT336_03195 [Micromonospora sp. NPDC000207]|uniref:hypothetical protein n=1 Tax=Micromonospora sp. NPDC000207 TaxID=3154246 RepID=UPI00331EE753